MEFLWVLVWLMARAHAALQQVVHEVMSAVGQGFVAVVGELLTRLAAFVGGLVLVVVAALCGLLVWLRIRRDRQPTSTLDSVPPAAAGS